MNLYLNNEAFVEIVGNQVLVYNGNKVTLPFNLTATPIDVILYFNISMWREQPLSYPRPRRNDQTW